MRTLAGFASGMVLAACAGDESLAQYGASGKTWVLSEMAHQSVESRVTIQFGKDGAVSGQGPCNRYSTQQSSPYPWFKIGPIAATKMACPDLALEGQYFEMLRVMTLVEVGQTILILSDEAETRTLIFTVE